MKKIAFLILTFCLFVFSLKSQSLNPWQWLTAPMKGDVYKTMSSIKMFSEKIDSIKVPMDTLDIKKLKAWDEDYYFNTVTNELIHKDNVEEVTIDIYAVQIPINPESQFDAERGRVEVVSAVIEGEGEGEGEREREREASFFYFSSDSIEIETEKYYFLFDGKQIAKNQAKVGYTYSKAILLKDSLIKTNRVIYLPSNSYYRKIVINEDSLLIEPFKKKYIVKKGLIDFNAEKRDLSKYYRISPLSNQQSLLWAQFYYTNLFIPVKLRLNDEFGVSNVSFDPGYCPFFGVKRRLGFYDDRFLSVGAFAGTSAISLKTEDMDDNLPGDVKIDQIEMALSWGIAAVYDLNSIQLGMLLGKDHLYSSSGDYWKSNHKWWLSMAIGIRFTKNKDE